MHYTMNSDFLKDLNQEQQKAVLQIDGPIIILAGAGSGKTRVLTYLQGNLSYDSLKNQRTRETK